jgi:stage V sporulation protein K
LKINIWRNQNNENSKKELPMTNKIHVINRTSKYKNQDSSQKNTTADVLRELNSLVGLKCVKKLINEVYAFVEIQKRRQKEQLATEPLSLHMVFKGNPGTGKTTVARIIGKLFKELGVLSKGHLVEVERADLVGEYIGHTAQRTKEQIRKALGGILFIDEAYSLARGGEKDFGKETIDTLVKSIEDQKDKMILILAGYREEMEWFTETNPGLRSRIPIVINFPDYSISELMSIGNLMLEQRQYLFSPGATEEMRIILEKEAKTHRHSGNARLVRNLVERAIRCQAVRLVKMPDKEVGRKELMYIKREDIKIAESITKGANNCT